MNFQQFNARICKFSESGFVDSNHVRRHQIHLTKTRAEANSETGAQTRTHLFCGERQSAGYHADKRGG